MKDFYEYAAPFGRDLFYLSRTGAGRRLASFPTTTVAEVQSGESYSTNVDMNRRGVLTSEDLRTLQTSSTSQAAP